MVIAAAVVVLLIANGIWIVVWTLTGRRVAQRMGWIGQWAMIKGQLLVILSLVIPLWIALGVLALCR